MGALVVEVRHQCHLGQSMHLVCPPGGERAGVPPSLPARCITRHTGASAHARRQACIRLARQRHRHRPVPGPGVHDLRVLVLPQHSATEREPESLHKPPGVGCALSGVWLAMPSGVDRAAYARQGGGSARACLQVCRHGAQAGTLARPHTHTGASAHASHAEDIDSNLNHGLGFVICVYFIGPQHSARQPETFH